MRAPLDRQGGQVQRRQNKEQKGAGGDEAPLALIIAAPPGSIKSGVATTGGARAATVHVDAARRRDGPSGNRDGSVLYFQQRLA